MKDTRLIFSFIFITIFSQNSNAQAVDDWLNENAILDIFHVITGPHSTRDEVMDFLDNEYFPAAENAYPETLQLHLEGIEGARKGHHAKFWIFASPEVRESYFPKDKEATEKFRSYQKKFNINVSTNKMIEIFRNWDWTYKTDWRIISKTDAEESLTDIKGKELDVHHVMLEYKGDGTKIEAELLKLIAGKDLSNSQFFILMGDRDMRVGGYAILELHKSGESNRDLLENSVIPMDKELFSSYHIVD